ncbi:hypothetical protein PIIN_05229 [Serendipita indica DSM 11827]|uniref:Meiotically up-regulated gene 152 protein n=1 Tax=Serendipita indica (strain DSM 11827) TaxID=1109443 RepID=G4TIY3_SERID|nr:hypothetical protein PIIN_05229 [Serendipita indica DSM 11827]
MERTPKAKARRQSLPTQHHLSHPTAQDDGSATNAAHAELVRFRDEMGIHGHPHSTPVAANAHYVMTFDAGMSKPSSTAAASNKRYSPSTSSAVDTATSRAEQRSIKAESSDVGTSLASANRDVNGNSSGGENAVTKKKVRKKWSIDETKMLVDGCRKHGVGNWKSMLDDPDLQFDPDRTPVDLKDRFRTYFPDTYRRLYPNAKTHIPSSSARAKRTELPDCPTFFEKSRSKKRRPFTKEEDDALREGFEKHGTVWAIIAKNPVLSTRRSTDLRDRFRNAFPDLYEKAGYKPRPTKPGKKQRGADIVESTRQTSGPIERRRSTSYPTRELTTVREMSMEPEQTLSTTPEAEDSFEMNGTNGNESASELPHTPQMETDMDIALDEKPIKTDTRSTSTAATYGDSDAVRSTNTNEHGGYASRQRSSSNAQRSISGEVAPSPQQGHPQNVQPSPAFSQGGHDHKISNASWYPARWLSGAQGGYMEDPNGTSGRGQSSHVQGLMDNFDGVSGLGLNGVGFPSNSGLGLGFGLVTGGWENQQTIIDRYDLPSSAAHLLHGGEFQSEAGIGDTGSSLSGLDEYNANSQMSMSSHHRYAGDLFLARGAGFGGGGWNGWGNHGFGFMFSGSNQGNMPSFARAGIDLGGPLPDASSHLSSGAQSPEFPQMLRQDQSIEDLGAALGGSILSSPHSVDPSKTLLHDIATPPPGTPAPTSPATRSFTNVDMYGNPNHVHAGPGVGLVRHSSMGTDLLLHGHNPQPPSSRHAFQQQTQSTSSHSRSYSQPPSEHRIQPGQNRSANTTVSSPVKSPFQNLDARGYEVSFDGLVNSRGGSPARHPNSFGQDVAGGQSAMNGQYQSHQVRHSHQYSQDSDAQHQEQQQQRTPVQKHAPLRNFDTLFPPANSASLFTAPGASWGQLSSVAMALDLHGASHPYGAGHAPASASQSSLGMQMHGSYGNHFMEQFADFETNALDLATTVTGPHSGTINLLSPNSSNQSVSSPPSQYPITPSTVSNHLQSPVSIHSQKHSPNPSGSKPVFKTPNLPASRSLNPNTYIQQQQQQQQFTSPSASLLPGSMSMDDSMIISQPAQSHLPQGGTTRRESFSYGTTAANQSVNSGMMLSLNRVQSAGSAGAGSGSLAVPQAHLQHHRSSAAQENMKQKGWDKTITTRRAKRASWGAAQSFGDV